MESWQGRKVAEPVSLIPPSIWTPLRFSLYFLLTSLVSLTSSYNNYYEYFQRNLRVYKKVPLIIAILEPWDRRSTEEELQHIIGTCVSLSLHLERSQKREYITDNAYLSIAFARKTQGRDVGRRLSMLLFNSIFGEVENVPDISLSTSPSTKYPPYLSGRFFVSYSPVPLQFSFLSFATYLILNLSWKFSRLACEHLFLMPHLLILLSMSKELFSDANFSVSSSLLCRLKFTQDSRLQCEIRALAQQFHRKCRGYSGHDVVSNISLCYLHTCSHFPKSRIS